MGRALNGTDAYLSRANSDEFEPLTQSYFLALRFKRATADAVAGSSQCLLSLGNSSSTLAGVSAWLYATTSYPGVRCCDASSNRAGKTNETALLDTDWHTLILVIDRDAETITGYLDGVEFDTDGGGGPTTASTASVATIDSGAILTVGAANTPGNYFAGSVADVVIGRGSIPTTAQIAAYVAGTCGAQAFASTWLVDCWPLVGNSLVGISHPNSAHALTANGTSTATTMTDPSISWGTDSDIAWDTDALADADGTALESTTTDGGRDWDEHSSYTTGALEVRGGEIRRVATNGNSSLCYLPTVGSRSMRIRTTFRKLALNSTSSSANLLLKVLTDANTLYYVNWSEGAGGNYNAGRFLAGTNTTLCTTVATTADDTDYAWVAEFTGTRFLLAVDGVLAVVARDDSAALRHIDCRPGIRIAGTADTGSNGSHFSDLVIERGPTSKLIDFGSGSGETADFVGLHLPAICATSTKTLVFAEERQGTANDDDITQIVQYTATSSDLTSWTKADRVATTTAIRHNPVPFVLPDGETVVLLYCALPAEFHGTSTNVTVHAITSTDEGATWGAASEITSIFSGWLTKGLVVGPGHGLVTSTGRLLTFASARDGDSDPREVKVIYSDDDGATWTLGQTITGASGMSESRAVQLSNGTILAQLRSNSTLINGDGADRFQGRCFATSTDNGTTWTAITRETEILSPYAPNLGESIDIGLQLIGNSPFLSHPAHQIRGILAVRGSADNGSTWNDPWASEGRISGGTFVDFALAAYSDILEIDDDTALIVNNGGVRLDQAYAGNFQQYLAVSTVPRAWLGVTNPPDPETPGDSDTVGVATFRHEGESIPYTPEADTAQGTVLVFGDMLGVVEANTPAGYPGALRLEGVFSFPKATDELILMGEPIFWDGEADTVTAESGYGELNIGVAVDDAEETDAYVLVKLTPGVH